MAYYVRTKICGVTTPADARQAALSGADAVGVNFFPRSPRYVDPTRAGAILRELPPLVEAVGVFVDEPLRDVFARAEAMGRLRTVQWHGHVKETVDSYPFQVVMAFPVAGAEDLRAVTRYVDLCRGLNRLPAALLLDAHVPGQHGGTGRTAPWRLLAGFDPGLPVILAGGLTPENVAGAVRVVRPYAVDVATGVESAPGRKDAEKVRRFIANAREAAAGL
jgi:phosphoribosylanthranilate isomerase